MNPALSQRPGWEVTALLLMALRVLTEEGHHELAERGHPDTRPAYAFAFQAIGTHGATAGELARALGITKQAVAKMIAELERAGYVERARSPQDHRRKLIVLTERAMDFLAQSATAFDNVADAWRRALGVRRFEQLLNDLEQVVRASRADGTLPPLRPIW